MRWYDEALFKDTKFCCIMINWRLETFDMQTCLTSLEYISDQWFVRSLGMGKVREGGRKNLVLSKHRSRKNVAAQLLSHVQFFVTLWTAAHQASLVFAQIHVHWVSDAIQPSHPLPSPSPPVINLSQHQGLFHWVGFSHQVAKVLKSQLQHQSFQWIFRTDFL